MNVAKLRELLEGVDGDIPVVRVGGDHELYEIDYAHESHAEQVQEGRFMGDMYEYYGDEHMQGGTKVDVFVIE